MEIGNLENHAVSEPMEESQAQISHLALDIGGNILVPNLSSSSGSLLICSNFLKGSLIKLVYFSQNSDGGCSKSSVPNGNEGALEGKLEFAKFETAKIHDCIDFIQSKQLKLTGCQHNGASADEKCVIKVVGHTSLQISSKKSLGGICLGKEDEMDSLVAGANFLLKSVHDEAFTYMDGQKEYAQIDQDDLYPYLLVNIGSGVSMIKVDGPGKFERVSGTNVGGGTFWGLGRLLKKCKSFDQLLELSHRGNNKVVDMLVGDIYGGTDYKKIGLSSTAIASSFGKAISDNKELEDYKPEDISRSLLRMISNNIGQISYLNALRFGLKRIFFAGFFLRGHAYTMDTIAVAVHFWSKGEAQAMFLRHEGFLGALGAFMSYEKHGFDNLTVHQLVQQSPIGASHGGDKTHSPADSELNDNPSINCSIYLS